jgi:hypothetical protein
MVIFLGCLDLNLLHACFSDVIRVISVCFDAPAPPSMGVCRLNVHNFLWTFMYFLENSKNLKMMNNVLGTIVPVFVLVRTMRV